MLVNCIGAKNFALLGSNITRSLITTGSFDQQKIDFWGRSKLTHMVRNTNVSDIDRSSVGSGLLAASLVDKTAGEWRSAPLPQWSKDQPFASGNWGGSCVTVTKQSRYPNAATLFAVWLTTAKRPVLANWTNYGIFPASLSGLAAPELVRPDINPSKFFGGQNLVHVYSEASQAVNVDFT